MSVTVTFVGSGDAFGSGGRLQTCIMGDAPGVRIAINFGCSSLIALTHIHSAYNGLVVEL